MLETVLSHLKYNHDLILAQVDMVLLMKLLLHLYIAVTLVDDKSTFFQIFVDLIFFSVSSFHVMPVSIVDSSEFPLLHCCEP